MSDVMLWSIFPWGVVMSAKPSRFKSFIAALKSIFQNKKPNPKPNINPINAPKSILISRPQEKPATNNMSSPQENTPRSILKTHSTPRTDISEQINKQKKSLSFNPNLEQVRYFDKEAAINPRVTFTTVEEVKYQTDLEITRDNFKDITNTLVKDAYLDSHGLSAVTNEPENRHDLEQGQEDTFSPTLYS